jgi:hypothetical protein
LERPVEPQVRRRWPAVLVAWSRVLSGRIRDPLVGREALAGIALCTAATAIGFIASWMQGRTMDAGADVINGFLSFGPAAGAIVTLPVASIAIGLAFTVLLLIFRGRCAANCWRQLRWRWWLSRSVSVAAAPSAP